VSCSPSQINQVLLNLVTNAAQAIEGYGKIMIKTLADDQWCMWWCATTARASP
jgi:signal transduction histidine kinase